VFVIGLLLLLLALAGIVLAIFPPVAGIEIGMLGMALGCGLSGALLAYLDAPSRREPPPPGSVPAKATILEARGTPGAVAGYQMVELTLEVHPRNGVPFQVKRKFSAGRLGRIEQGRKLDVVYDPVNPEKLDLA
jgi:hypothetical protein